MKFKDSIAQYLNDLPNRWSANFLALLGGVNFIIALVGAFITVLYEILLSSEPSNFIEFIKEFLFGILGYSIFFCFVSFVLAACIAIPYILMILSKKRSFVIINMLIILSFFITIFALSYEGFNMTGGGGIYFVFFLFVNIFAVPIPILIYLILLIIEHFSKFRIKESLVLKSPVFKKYIKIFYCYSLLVIFSLLAGGLYLLVT